jgi:hypothetical protein
MIVRIEGKLRYKMALPKIINKSNNPILLAARWLSAIAQLF